LAGWAVYSVLSFRFTFSYPNHFGNRSRKPRRQLDLVEGVTIALEKDRLLSIETEHMIAIGRLQNAHERLRMEAVGNNRQLAHRPLKAVNLEEVSVREDRDAIKSVIPKASVRGQIVKLTQYRRTLTGGIFLPERRFQLPYEIPKSDLILSLVRVRPMGRLVQRKKR
jgi:hypothetical protein